MPKKSLARAPCARPSFLVGPLAGLELVHDIDECIEIIERLPLRGEGRTVKIKEDEGFEVTEAPRGILYHTYKINREGIIVGADIVPNFLNLPLEEATLKCEIS